MPAAKTIPLPETHSIVIEGELVQVRRTVIERQVRTKDLLAEIAQSHPLETGRLPRHCIAYARVCDERGQPLTLYVLEQPAGLVPIRFKSDSSFSPQTEENLRELKLSWPPTLWLVRHLGASIQDLFLCCTQAPVERIETPIFVLPMPNQHEQGHGAVCLGNLVVPELSCPAARTERLLEVVRTSLWNHDLLPDFNGLNLTGLVEWAEKSATEEHFWRTLNLTPHKHQTLSNFIRQLLGETP